MHAEQRMTEGAGRNVLRGGILWRMVAWTAAGLLLLSPLVAMQFTDEVEWDVADFGLFGVLLIGAGAVFELAARKTGDSAFRAAVGVALAAAFLLLWVNGGVGIIGSEDSVANVMYLGVLAVGVIGAIMARLRPHGMARAMFAAAVAQAVVAVIAVSAGLGSTVPFWPWDILILTAFFSALWVGSALLFRRAAFDQRPAATGPEPSEAE